MPQLHQFHDARWGHFLPPRRRVKATREAPAPEVIVCSETELPHRFQIPDWTCKTDVYRVRIKRTSKKKREGGKERKKGRHWFGLGTAGYSPERFVNSPGSHFLYLHKKQEYIPGRGEQEIVTLISTTTDRPHQKKIGVISFGARSRYVVMAIR